MSAPDFRRDEAAEWVIRLSAEDAGEGEHVAFMSWLNATPDARRAYDDALDVWLSSGPPKATAARRRVIVGRPPAFWGKVAAALACVVILTGAVGWIWSGRPSSQVLRTGVDERREFALADGSRVTLGSDSLVTVQLGLGQRQVLMKRGDAVFRIASRLAPPFQVIAGDDALRVMGTEFAVHRRDGQLRVVVRKGLVAIGPAKGEVGPRVRLPSGSELNHKEGTEVFQVATVDPETAFPW